MPARTPSPDESLNPLSSALRAPDGADLARSRSKAPPSRPQPAAWVAAMATGDEAALSQLYDRFSGRLYALALRIMGDEADASEVVLDVFTKAWKKASKYDPARSTVATWLSMMLRSRAIDLLRAKRSRQQWILDAQHSKPHHPPAMGEGPVEVFRQTETGERRRHIDVALRTLNPDQRTAIELAFYDGLTQSEIAERLETPLGTIKTRIRTGMRLLRDHLEPLYGGELS